MVASSIPAPPHHHRPPTPPPLRPVLPVGVKPFATDQNMWAPLGDARPPTPPPSVLLRRRLLLRHHTEQS
ncbi:hypothetical protein HanRHA438_Chr04g0181221 [Helianthus annuus]|nr:hypothetical protein HanRHA438_Chr04g0181221 [Helianthus annuus]